MQEPAARLRDQFPEGVTSSDQAGLADFWRVYAEHYDQLTEESRTLLVVDPDFGPLITAMSAEELEAQNQESRRMLEAAIVHGEWDSYLSYLREQGQSYARMGVAFSGWFRVLGVIRPRLTSWLVDAFASEPERLHAALTAMDRFIDLAMGVIGEEYLNAKEDIILRQQEAIRDLSTPVLPVRDEMLLLPVVGVIDSNRARQMTDQLLNGIRDNRAKVVVIDITGVPAVDSMVANHLVQAVEAARLLGAHTILTGLSTEVAQTVVRIGVDLSKVMTTGSLRDGILEANRLLGYQVIRAQ